VISTFEDVVDLYVQLMIFTQSRYVGPCHVDWQVPHLEPEEVAVEDLRRVAAALSPR
jgi:hypothetical protein